MFPVLKIMADTQHESLICPRHSQLNTFVHLPQLSLSTAPLLKDDNDISLFQNLLLTLP